jgi:SAM-dependent methyltransferase
MSKRCPFCGSERHRIEFSTDIGDSLFCWQCGGIENHGNTDAEYTASYYSDNYFVIEAQQIARFTRILKDIEPSVKNHRILDFGCGTGMFLKAAHTLGYRDSVGIDISVDAVEIARKKLVHTDVCVQLSSDPILGRFGVIAFMDSIAHIDNLQEQFSSIISDSLITGGLLIIKTPRYSKTYFYYGMIVGWLLGLIGKSGFVSSQIFCLPALRLLFTEKAMDAFMMQHGLVKVFTLVEPEYSRDKQKIVGLKNHVAHFLLRGVPGFMRGGNQSILFVARKK